MEAVRIFFLGRNRRFSSPRIFESRFFSTKFKMPKVSLGIFTWNVLSTTFCLFKIIFVFKNVPYPLKKHNCRHFERRGLVKSQCWSQTSISPEFHEYKPLMNQEIVFLKFLKTLNSKSFENKIQKFFNCKSFENNFDIFLRKNAKIFFHALSVIFLLPDIFKNDFLKILNSANISYPLWTQGIFSS